MRLRYLRVQGRPPLEDVSARFGFEPVLPRECAVHFVVGVNGTGKTRLLQALAQTLVSLGDGDVPPFPVTVAYDLGMGDGKRTLVFAHSGNRADARLIEFTPALPEDFDNWDALVVAESPQMPNAKRTAFRLGEALIGGISQLYLPKLLWVFTTGAQTQWEELLKPQLGQDAVPFDELIEESFRPPEWTIMDQQNTDGTAKEAAPLEGNTEARLGELITPDLLQLAFLGVELAERAKERIQETDRNDGYALPSPNSWQRIRDAVGGPTSVSLVLRFDQAFVSAATDPSLRQIRNICTYERQEPMTDSPRWTELIFDLDAAVTDATNDSRIVAALVETLAGSTPSRFGVYRQLRDWWRAGSLMKATLAVHKRGELMLFDSLSDGERSFLGRMGLLHVLADQDDVLLILDEPETHFNDVWKRQVVDILDDNMRERANEVVIATNSSIGLTDVFREQILLLTGREGATQIHLIKTPTFGADPSEVMIDILGAPDSIGKFAQEELEALLKRNWTAEQREELARYIEGTGAGYFRSELRAIWRRLNATQNQITS